MSKFPHEESDKVLCDPTIITISINVTSHQLQLGPVIHALLKNPVYFANYLNYVNLNLYEFYLFKLVFSDIIRIIDF